MLFIQFRMSMQDHILHLCKQSAEEEIPYIYDQWPTSVSLYTDKKGFRQEVEYNIRTFPFKIQVALFPST